MNAFNRFVMVLLLVALIAVASAVVVFAWINPEGAIDALRDAVDWLEDNNETLQRVVLTSGAAIVALLALSVLVYELVPRSGTEVRVTDVRAGDAVLTTTSIGQRVEEAVLDVPHVASARATVRARRKGVLVSIELHVDPDANLATVADEAAVAVRDVLTDRVHVALLEPPKVRLHYRELRLQRGHAARVPTRPAPAPRPVPVLGDAPSSVEAEKAPDEEPASAAERDGEPEAERREDRVDA